MARLLPRGLCGFATVAFATVLLSPHIAAAASEEALEVPGAIKLPANMTDDAAALWLARRCAEGGEDARPALVAALDRMGWGVKDREGNLSRTPAIAAPTGLAMRDYEIESLFWNAQEQPGLRLISYARALAVALPTIDPEDLAQGLLDSVRDGAESTEPRRRFWARFIIALGMAQDGSDLSGPGDPQLMPLDTKALGAAMPKMPNEIPEIDENASDAVKIQMGLNIAASMMRGDGFNAAALMEASTPKPVWPHDDPVLGKTPLPDAGAKSAEDRMNELQGELNEVMMKTLSQDSQTAAAAQKRYARLSAQMTNVNEAIQASAHRRMLIENDPDFDEDEPDEDGASRFMAEHRSTPLSVLQVALLTRVLVAEILGDPATQKKGASNASSVLPVAAVSLSLPRLLAQAAPAGGPPTSFSGQLSSAGADIWATASGTYTSLVLDAHVPDSPFSNRVGQANAIMGWLKTIVMLAKSKITIEVQNDPLIRTKRRDQSGQQRKVKCTVEVDFPKTPDAVKAMRGLLNIASIDLQVPDGGPVGGAKVTWRLTEGAENAKYATASGGKAMKPGLAVIQFAKMAEGSAHNSAYVSYTNDQGEASITIEGKPQKKNLPVNVREQKRRGGIAVEVNMKVGNLLQDFNDAIGAAGVKGAPGPLGVLTMISEMVQRSSLFFQAGKGFGVIDWVPPAWEGDIVIRVTGSGSETKKGEKGGPDVRYEWSMNRAMEAHLQTPESEQEDAHERGVQDSNRITLEVANDTKRYKLTDFSSQTSTDVEAAYTAEGPVENPPKPGGGPAWPSRAEPAGTATLTIWPEVDPPKYSFTVEPSFKAKALIFTYERNKGRVKTETRTDVVNLMGEISLSELWDNGTWDPETMTITGNKTFEAKGYLPFVPEFDVTIEFAYTLKYEAPPPESVR
jgi:hypothetical protein